MRHWIFTTLAVILGLSIVFGFSSVSLPDRRGSGETEDVARVNKHPINRAAFERGVDQYAKSPYAFMMGSGPGQALSLRNMMLDQYIDHFVKVDAAKREGNRAGRKQIQDRISEMLDARIQQARSEFKDDKEFTERFLVKRWKVKTQDELRAKWQREISQGEKDAIREEIVLANLQRTVEKRAATQPIDKAKPEDLEVSLRGILVKIEPKKRTEAQALKAAQGIAAKLKGGADFAAVAREQSEDDATKAKGGDMGWLAKNMIYPSELADPAFALKQNETSAPIKTSTGYYILRAGGRRYSPRIYWQNYLEEAKKKAKIEIYDPALLAYREATDIERSGNEKLSQAKDDAARKKAAEEMAKSGERVIAVYTKALEKVSHNDVRAAMFYRIGELHNQAGNTAKAAEAFNNAAQSAPTPQIYLSLGDAQLALKQDSAAVESYKNAAAMSEEQSAENQPIHSRLEGAFGALNQKDLVAKEKAWLAENKKKFPNGGGGMFGMPGGMFNVGP